MFELVPLLAVFAVIAYVGLVALVRWRRRKRPLVTSEDYGCGCALVVALTAVVGFTVSLWWLDESWWIALLTGPGLALVVALYIGAHLPPSEDADK